MNRFKHFFCLLLAFLTVLPAALGESTDDLAQFADFSEKFGAYFLEAGAEPVITENSYRSHDMYFTIRSERANRSDVYVVDIYVRSVEVIRRAFGGGQWHEKLETVPAIAERSGAILALTGDNSQNFNAGWVFANGEQKRKCTAKPGRNLCILYKNGVMETVRGKNVDNDAVAAAADRIWQSFFFGPALLNEEGKAYGKFDSGIASANPRFAIGYFEPGHYCLVQADGRSTKSAIESGGKNKGMELTALASYMESLGCKAAYNLDGGRSSVLWFNGSIVSTPYKGGREVGDIIILAEKN